MSKKISEWLKELPTPYRELALNNYANGKIRDVLVSSMSLALSFAFDWRQSPEGHEYWNDVFIRLATNDLLASNNGEYNIKQQLDEVTKQRDEAIRRQGGPEVMSALTVIDTINGLLERAGITGDKTTQRKVILLVQQRDELVNALINCREDSVELLGERHWWKDEPRLELQARYEETAENVRKADATIAAVKGGEL